ncbi:MAG: isoprenylcysteine carboxylmethyltransferase family protein, partial [Myxococcales bacterium]|nr:isoprenylcysteine carboxylmethyltransferase family protein [Myxococcales bacterium]
IFLRLFGGMLWLSVLLYLLYPRALSWSHLPLPWAVRWAACGTALLMGPCFLWVFRHIGKNITQTVAIRQQHQLVKTGPYRWIRHPLYSFGIFYFLSFSVAAASWWMLLLAGFALIMLLVRLPKEEEKLIEAFGQDYIDYKGQTGAFFPRLFPSKPNES